MAWKFKGMGDEWPKEVKEKFVDFCYETAQEHQIAVVCCVFADLRKRAPDAPKTQLAVVFSPPASMNEYKKEMCADIGAIFNRMVEQLADEEKQQTQ